MSKKKYKKIITRDIYDYSQWDRCSYCDNKADYTSLLQEMNVCKYCVKDYIKQEVLTKFIN